MTFNICDIPVVSFLANFQYLNAQYCSTFSAVSGSCVRMLEQTKFSSWHDAIRRRLHQHLFDFVKLICLGFSVFVLVDVGFVCQCHCHTVVLVLNLMSNLVLRFSSVP